MVRVPIARNHRAAMATGEIFDIAGEFARHVCFWTVLKTPKNNHLDPRLSRE